MRKLFRMIIWLIIDIILVNISIYSAYLVRFKGIIEPPAFFPYLYLWPHITLAHLISFAIFKLYYHPIKFSKKEVLINTTYASTIAAMASISIVYTMRSIYGFMPSSVFAFACIFNIILIGGWRVYIRYEPAE